MKAAASRSMTDADVAASKLSAIFCLSPYGQAFRFFWHTALPSLSSGTRPPMMAAALLLFLPAVLLAAAPSSSLAIPYGDNPEPSRSQGDAQHAQAGSNSIRAFAEKGIPHAQFLLGFAYRSGDGVVAN